MPAITQSPHIFDFIETVNATKLLVGGNLPHLTMS